MSRFPLKRIRLPQTYPVVLAALWSIFMFAGGGVLGFVVGDGPPLFSQYQFSAPFQLTRTIQADAEVAEWDFTIMRETLKILQDEYMGPLPEPEVMMQAAVEGLLEELGDPYTLLLRPELASLNEESMDGEFGGIGARVEWDEELEAVRIVEPFEDSPAWRAGLLRGDLIISVNGEPIAELGIDGAITRVRGPVGTNVVLGIQRGEETWEETVRRDTIEIRITEQRLLGPDESVGYFKLSSFNQKSSGLVRTGLEDLLDSNVDAIILDLRDNGGGLLSESVSIAGMFVGPNLVVTQHMSEEESRQHRASQRAVLPDHVPLVVLVNESSASASEVVSGAIQDWGRGKLIGEPTFGKGSVQTTFRLPDSSQLRVTSARWHTPLGRTIDIEGLTPDLLVEMSEEDYAAERDPQLDAALEYLGVPSMEEAQN